jgi:hypothetical protein
METSGNASRPGARQIAAGALFLAAYFVARAVLEQHGIDTGWRVLAALLPALPFVWVLWEIARGVRSLDELEQRIQLEALAFAFPVVMILLLVLGLLELAIPLPPQDLSFRHVWAMLPLIYIIGLLKARRRYQ